MIFKYFLNKGNLVNFLANQNNLPNQKKKIRAELADNLVVQTAVGAAAGAAGLAGIGGGVGMIYDQINDLHKRTFSSEASAFHAMYNQHKEILGVPQSVSFLTDGTFANLAKNPDLAPLLNALSLNNPAGIIDLLGNSNFNTLLNKSNFSGLLGNQASLDLLLGNASLFNAANNPLINIISENPGLQTLMNDGAFVKLLGNQSFQETLKANKLVDLLKPDVLGAMNPEFAAVFGNSDLTKILGNVLPIHSIATSYIK